MYNNQIIERECKHNYIIKLGENKKRKETYDYCLTCGKRIQGNFYHCLVIDATEYMEEYPIVTEEDRRLKVLLIQEQFHQKMIETGITQPEYLINDFKLEIEEKRTQMLETRNKILLKTISQSVREITQGQREDFFLCNITKV